MEYAANTLVTKLVSTIEEHGQLFKRAKVKKSDNPALLKVIEEQENIEPHVSNVEFSYKAETESNRANR